MINLTPWDLSLAALLVLLMAALSFRLKLAIERPLLIGALRATVQLSLVGLLLKQIFTRQEWLWVALIAVLMLAVAVREVQIRQQQRFRGHWGVSIGGSALLLSSFSVSLLSLHLIIGPEPWHSPQYAIPLLGMLLGNAMTGVSLALERLTQSCVQQRELIEQQLLLGQDRFQSLQKITQQSVRAGLIPTINAMTTAGLVNLPGMMTGQIMAGSPPLQAVKYQILILLLIAASSGFGVLIALRLASARLFDARQRLRLEVLSDKSG